MSTLNSDQRNAFADVLHFINDPNKKIHRISGGAGTGKSFFISKVADDILKHKAPGNPLKTVAVTATTNKAAAVLKNSMQHRRGDIQTIYSFMNLRVHNNHIDGSKKIVPTAKWMVHHATLIIVDEASMVTKSLYDYIDKGTDNTCKILFVGDKNQLAPVKENISPVYSNNHKESFLNIPVRNATQPALMALCEQAKDTVITGKFHKIQEVPGVIDFVDGTELQGLLEREYHTEDATKRIICYTNKRVQDYNLFVRELRGYTEQYQVGEIVTNNSSTELLDKTRLYTDQIVKIINRGEPYIDDKLIEGAEIEFINLEVEDPETSLRYAVTVCADPPDREEILKYFRSNKRWDKYFSFAERIPDLRSVASSTAHKAQGSTYDSVIVDLKDIGKSTNSEQTARLLYVALSRAKNRLFIRGNLPERFY